LENQTHPFFTDLPKLMMYYT